MRITKRMALPVALTAAVCGIALTSPTAASAATPYVNNPSQCQGGADPGWFCAYSGPYFTGQSIGMYDCGPYTIPWVSDPNNPSTWGSWDNEQTPGTRPWLYWVDPRSTPWHMPAADSYQKTGVNWTPVYSITNC